MRISVASASECSAQVRQDVQEDIGDRHPPRKDSQLLRGVASVPAVTKTSGTLMIGQHDWPRRAVPGCYPLQVRRSWLAIPAALA